MLAMPLHPALVHLPLGLAVVLPLLAVVGVWAILTERIPARAWIAVIGLQAVLVGGALVAMNTGEADEERVEEVVAERAIESHEEKAELFTWAAAGILGLAALGLLHASPRSRRVGGAMLWAAPVAFGIQTLLALQVGRAGGELVYTHGAAAAHVSASAGAAAGDPETSGPESEAHDDDDDDD